MADGIEDLRVKLESANANYRFLDSQYRELRQRYDLLLKEKEGLQAELDKLKADSRPSFTAEETSAQFQVILESLNRDALHTGYAIKAMDVEMDTRLVQKAAEPGPLHEPGSAKIKFTFVRAAK